MARPGHAWVYKTALWGKLRRAQLRREPLCRFCSELGRTIAADTVDHIKAHKGDRGLAFDPDNLQSLCKHCHDTHAQRRDLGLPMAGCDANGYPLDEDHTWGTHVGKSGTSV